MQESREGRGYVCCSSCSPYAISRVTCHLVSGRWISGRPSAWSIAIQPRCHVTLINYCLLWNGAGSGRWSSAIVKIACGSVHAQPTQNGMEHTTTALISEVPLLHRRQKYIVDSSSVCSGTNVTSTLDLWLKRVWSRLLTRTTCWPMSDHERSVGNGLNGWGKNDWWRDAQADTQRKVRNALSGNTG